MILGPLCPEALPLPKTATTSCTLSTEADRRRDTVCNVTCLPGYTSTKDSYSYICDVSSSCISSDGEISCQPVECGPLPQSEGVLYACDGTTFGSSCTSSCLNGFYAKNETSDSKFVCTAGGSWQGSFECERVSCGDLQPTLSVLNQATDCTDVLFGSTCNAFCRDGYVSFVSWLQCNSE